MKIFAVINERTGEWNWIECGQSARDNIENCAI